MRWHGSSGGALVTVAPEVAGNLRLRHEHKTPGFEVGVQLRRRRMSLGAANYDPVWAGPQRVAGWRSQDISVGVEVQGAAWTARLSGGT